MGDTIFSAPWLPSIRRPDALYARSALRAVSGRFEGVPRRTRAVLCPLTILLCFFITVFGASQPRPGFSAQLTDREEDGLVGPVQSVETRESLLVQTDRYDSHGRLVERIQGGRESAQGLWPLQFSYRYDQVGRRVAEVVRDARGELVKETRSVYDDHGNRSAELAVWGDGTFENVSLYEYDEAHRRIRGLHYNGVQVINRNLYAYDGAGRLLRERFERNYQYDAAGHHVLATDRFDVGYDVAILYDDRGHVREKVVSDLKGRRQSRSEFRYDERGSQIEERSYDAAGRLTDRKAYRYDYDAAGNWIAETFHWWEVSDGRETLRHSNVRERSITYY